MSEPMVPPPPPSSTSTSGRATTALFLGGTLLVPDPFDVSLERRHGRDERIVWREEGVQTSVSIHENTDGRTLMYLDGLHQASDAPDMVRLHRLIGHLAMVLHPDPRRALVVGLGGGATPGAVSQHDAASIANRRRQPPAVIGAGR